MKEWSYMVVRRYYKDGRYEAEIIGRETFRREAYPGNPEEYRQEFCPCADFEKAVKAMEFARLFQKTEQTQR